MPWHRVPPFTGVLAAFLLVSCGGSTLAPDEGSPALLWGTLKPGYFGVGYRALWESDPSRAYGPDSARPILIAMWYPTLNRSSPGLSYGDYFELPPYRADAAYAPRMAAFMRDLALRETVGAADSVRAERFPRTPVAASREAAPAPGAFPVILYHPGAEGSFEENSVLFEYLASHGYVVISSAYQSSDPQHLGNNIGDFGEQIADLAFLHRYAATLPFADSKKTAAVGHSIGAQILLQWIGEADCPLDAAVSLDTTLEYSPEDFPRHQSLRGTFRRLRKPEIPVLLAASAGRQPNFLTFDAYLGRAPRYEVAVTRLTHSDFETHGAIRRAFTAASVEEQAEAQAIRRSYEQLVDVIRAFLDRSFRADAPQLPPGTAELEWAYRPAVR